METKKILYDTKRMLSLLHANIFISVFMLLWFPFNLLIWQSNMKFQYRVESDISTARQERQSILNTINSYEPVRADMRRSVELSTTNAYRILELENAISKTHETGLTELRSNLGTLINRYAALTNITNTVKQK